MEISSCFACQLSRLLHGHTRLLTNYVTQRHLVTKSKEKRRVKVEKDSHTTLKLPTLKELQNDTECKRPLFYRRNLSADLYVLESQWAADLARLAQPPSLQRNQFFRAKTHASDPYIYVEACPGPGFITQALLERYPESPVLTFCSSSVYIRYLNKLRRFYGADRLKVLHPYKLFSLTNSYFRLAHSASGLRPKKNKTPETNDKPLTPEKTADDDDDENIAPPEHQETRLRLTAQRVYDAIALQISDLPQRRLAFVGVLPVLAHFPFVKSMLDAKIHGVGYDNCIDFTATLVVDERMRNRLTYAPPPQVDADYFADIDIERRRDTGYAADYSMPFKSSKFRKYEVPVVDDTISPLFARLRSPQTTVENVQQAVARNTAIQSGQTSNMRLYSALTVLMNLCFHIEVLGTIPRTALFPNPPLKSLNMLESCYIVRISSRSWSDIQKQMGLGSREQLVEASFLIKELMSRRKEPLIWRLETWMPRIAEHLILHPSGLFDTYLRIGDLSFDHFRCLINVVINSEMWKASPLRHNFLLHDRILSIDDVDLLTSVEGEDEVEEAEDEVDAV